MAKLKHDMDRLSKCSVSLPTKLGAPERGYNSVGRVAALQAACRRFESDYLHQPSQKLTLLGNAQASLKRKPKGLRFFLRTRSASLRGLD